MANTSNILQLLPSIKAHLDEQALVLEKIQNHNAQSGYLNAKQAAEYLGISERLFNERLRHGAWTNYRLGKRRLFLCSDLDKDMEAWKQLGRFRKMSS